MFDLLLYQPLFNLLIGLYLLAFRDLGLAIILLTVLVRLLLYPLFYKMFKNQTIMQRLQPEMKRVQERYKDNKEEQAKAMMELYRHHNINPFSSIGLIVLQLPILIALYQVFLYGLKEEALTGLYAFLPSVTHIDPTFLYLLNLEEKSMVIVVLAAAAQYYQSRLTLPKTNGDKNDVVSRVGRQMMYIGPVLTIVILGVLPAAVGLYWLTSSLFSLVQQLHINRKLVDQE